MSYWHRKRATLSRPSGEWNDDEFDVLANTKASPTLRSSPNTRNRSPRPSKKQPHLCAARDLLRPAGSKNAADYVARTLKSVALRHAQRLVFDAQPKMINTAARTATRRDGGNGVNVRIRT
jgi:hypothetical protein